MKKYIYFFTIIFIIIALSLTITLNVVNGNNKSNIILAEKEEQTKFENDQDDITEEAEKVDKKEESNNEEVQSITEVIDSVQPQVIETAKEEKVIETKPKTNKTTQVIQENKVQTTTQEIKVEKETPKVQPQVVEEKPKQEEPKKVETPKCSGNSHGVGTGNSGKWFNSESEAINYYKSIIKKWGDKWENFEIDDDTYNKNCPYGYEDWSCPYCDKWTINFYYN